MSRPLQFLAFLFGTILVLASCDSKKDTDTSKKQEDSLAVADTKADSTEGDPQPYSENVYFRYEEDLSFYPAGVDKAVRMKVAYRMDLSGAEYGPFGEVEAKEIEIDFAPAHSMSATARPIDFVQKLLPGNVYQLQDYEEKPVGKAVYWTCPKCEPGHAAYRGDTSMGAPFPSKEMNLTLPVSIYDFAVRNKDYRLLNLATYMDGEAIFMGGRFSGALMGAALYRREKGRYELVAFKPFVNMFGTYNSPNEPSVYVAGDQIILEYYTTNGGAGAAYTTMSEFLLQSGNTFKTFHTSAFKDYANTRFGDWQSIQEFGSENGKTIFTKRTFGALVGCEPDSYEYHSWIFKDAPACMRAEAHKVIDAGAPVQFKLTTKYELRNGGLEEIECAVESLPLEGEWREYGN